MIGVELSSGIEYIELKNFGIMGVALYYDFINV